VWTDFGGAKLPHFIVAVSAGEDTAPKGSKENFTLNPSYAQ
jgi:hypothetical protein